MFFKTKNEGPGGDLDRITVKKFPDQYPAEKNLMAEPVKGDSKDMAVIRPLLKQTELGEDRGGLRRLYRLYVCDRNNGAPCACRRFLDVLRRYYTIVTIRPFFGDLIHGILFFVGYVR